MCGLSEVGWSLTSRSETFMLRVTDAVTAIRLVFLGYRRFFDSAGVS